ncbi:MAG: hypothetical protein GX126_01275 [Bacteroidales bacterium]|jgi:hypothetical protein|nr:hypothetical protein [Bacteroidales bacterium]
MKKEPNLYIGAINPFALTEVLTGRMIDWNKRESVEVIEDTLETEYSELFDMKYNSPLFAGLRLTDNNTAEPVDNSEISIRGDNDTETPDLSNIKTIGGLKKAGINITKETKIQSAFLSRGILNLRLDLPEMDKTLSKTRLSSMMASIVMSTGSSDEWTPENCVWKDTGDFFKAITEYTDPIQGAIGNSYFIAALSAVAWASPHLIIHRNRANASVETSRMNVIPFYSKGGKKDAPARKVEVSDKTIFKPSNNLPVYCRSSDSAEIFPALYEKAFAKWILQTNSDKPDITKTAYGDPVKAMAQLNNKTPHYYYTDSRTGDDLYSIVRSNSMSYKTIHPMVAWTYGSNNDYSGINIVGNHAYSVLGWALKGIKKYFILRNPWGVSEPSGLNTYQGVLTYLDKSFWMPVTTIENHGVFAIEANAFKNLFAGLGVAK